MQQEIATPVDLKVLMNHIYEYKKGVRRLVLYTFNRKYESFAITRLERQNIIVCHNICRSFFWAALP